MKERIMAYIAIGMTLVACSTDEEEQRQERSDVAFSVPVEEWRSGTIATRAPSITDFYQEAPVTAQKPTSIGVWGYNSNGDWMKSCDETPIPMKNIEFTYEEAGDKLYHKGTWNQSTNKAEGGAYPWGSNNKDYTFYAYAPYTSDADAGYDKDTKQLTLRIPAVGTTDYLVAKTEKSHNPHNDGAIVKFTLADYTFKHITACIQLAFAIDSRYAQNRYLDIRKVTVAVNGGQGADATYTYNTTDGTATWSGTEADGKTMEVTATGAYWYLGDKTLEGMHASERYHAYNHFYIKEQACDDAPITLKVTYDVYDMEGLLTRQGAVAESTLKLGPNVTTSSGGKKSFLSGYYYNVLVYIIPDYLYILSDNDNGADATLVLK